MKVLFFALTIMMASPLQVRAQYDKQDSTYKRYFVGSTLSMLSNLLADATALPLTALQRALAWRQPAAGLTHHSDRGSQDASDDSREVLRAHRMVQSTSRRGDC
jgi:transposase InsO family protein